MQKRETNLRKAIQIWVNKRRFVSHINCCVQPNEELTTL